MPRGLVTQRTGEKQFVEEKSLATLQQLKGGE